MRRALAAIALILATACTEESAPAPSATMTSPPIVTTTSPTPVVVEIPSVTGLAVDEATELLTEDG